VLACVALAGAVGLVVNALTPTVYEATVRLEVQKPALRTPWTDQALAASSAQIENMNLATCAEMIKRRSLLARLATDISHEGLWIAEDERRPWWAPRLGTVVAQVGRQAAGWMGAGSEPARRPGAAPVGASTAASTGDLDASVLELASMITVRPVHDTRLVDVIVDFGEPRLAREIADRLALMFVNDQQALSCAADTAGLAYLQEQLSEVRERIDALPIAVPATADQNPDLLRARAARLNTALGDLDMAWRHASADGHDASVHLARLDRYERQGGELEPGEIGSERLDALQRDLDACGRRIAAARTLYKPMHPRLAALDSEYAALRALERQEIPNVRRDLEAQVVLQSAHAARLKSAMADSERTLGGIQARADLLAQRAASASADRELEGRLLSRIRDRLLDAPLQRSPVQIVDAAMVSPEPVRPRRALNLAVALVVGLLFGSGTALVRHSTRVTLRGPADVAERLDLPVVAEMDDPHADPLRDVLPTAAPEARS